MKEFIMQESEEMTTFGSVWKKYEPVAELVRCKNCKYRESPDGYALFCSKLGRMVDDNWYCGDGERRKA